MWFVSFQPKDWRTCDRSSAPERNVLGFDPLYASLADTEAACVVNTACAEPSVPEIAIWFRTNDWYCIPKVFQYRWISKLESCYPTYYLSRNDAHCKFKPKHGTFDDVLREECPYSSEFLVSPDKIKIVAEVNIKNTVLEFIDTCDNKDKFYVQYDNDLADFKNRMLQSAHEMSFKRTDDDIYRMAEAKYYFDIYIENGLVVYDYERIVGLRFNEKKLDVKKFFDKYYVGYYNRKRQFDEEPTDHNFKRYISYMEEKLGISKLLK